MGDFDSVQVEVNKFEGVREDKFDNERDSMMESDNYNRDMDMDSGKEIHNDIEQFGEPLSDSNPNQYHTNLDHNHHSNCQSEDYNRRNSNQSLQNKIKEKERQLEEERRKVQAAA